MILTQSDLRRRTHAQRIVRQYNEALRAGQVITTSDVRRRINAERILRSYEGAGR